MHDETTESQIEGPPEPVPPTAPRLESMFSPQVLAVAEYWIGKGGCRDNGRLCGKRPGGTGCRKCRLINGTPGPFRIIAEAELMDQPDGVEPIAPLTVPFIDHRNFRFYSHPNTAMGIVRAGWYRRYNGKMIESWWNKVDPKDWKADIQAMLDSDFRLCRVDPASKDDRTDDAPSIDRGPGLYADLSDGRSVRVENGTDARDLVDGTFPASDSVAVPLTTNSYACLSCGHRGPMHRHTLAGTTDRARLRCTKCNTPRTRKNTRKKAKA